MIALLEIPETLTEIKGCVFRGRSLNFWFKQIFKELPWSSGTDSDLDYLVLFNPEAFLEIDVKGFRGIISSIQRIAAERMGNEAVFYPEGNPFMALPVSIIKSLKKDDQWHPGTPGWYQEIFNLIENNKSIDVVCLESVYTALTYREDFRRIENNIIDFQSTFLMETGVLIEDYNHFYIEGIPAIGSGTRIGSGVVIKGDSTIGCNTVIYPHAYLENASVGNNCEILPGCIIRDSSLENLVIIGPYTHLRNGALVKEGAKMGNFVEMKKSTLGKGSKSMHLTYIGDAEVGEKVNIGAGTITCNYDGKNKNKTVIEDNVFIGSGTELVAPVTIKKGGYVGAGSTITQDVPPESLGLARQRQRNLLNWVKRQKERQESE